jgi:hypothetical protein
LFFVDACTQYPTALRCLNKKLFLEKISIK